jgi:hypothetical protein
VTNREDTVLVDFSDSPLENAPSVEHNIWARYTDDSYAYSLRQMFKRENVGALQQLEN